MPTKITKKMRKTMTDKEIADHCERIRHRGITKKELKELVESDKK